MTFTRVAALTSVLFCCAGPASAQVKLEFHDGLVNLTTQNAPLRTILTEWARLGGTQVVNVERLAGAPVTLQLTDVPETQALDIILRGPPDTSRASERRCRGATSRRSIASWWCQRRHRAIPPAPRPAAATPPPFQQTPQPFIQATPDDNPVRRPPDDDRPNRVVRRRRSAGDPDGRSQRAGARSRIVIEDETQQAPAPTPAAPTNPFGVTPERPGRACPLRNRRRSRSGRPPPATRNRDRRAAGQFPRRRLNARVALPGGAGVSFFALTFRDGSLPVLMSEIDRYKPEDRRGLDLLYRRTQGADAADAQRLRWDWQHRRNPYNPTGQPDIWVAREGPTVVGQYPTLPVRVSLKGLEVDGAWGARCRGRA